MEIHEARVDEIKVW